MKLSDWLQENEIPTYLFCRQNHFGMQSLHDHVLRGKPLTLRLSKEIVEITDGEVTLQDLMLSDEDWPDARRKYWRSVRSPTYPRNDRNFSK